MPTPWLGGPVTARARCVLAPNPGPMTLEGTNTWVLSEPGTGEAVVVDPGPLDEGHLARVLDTVAQLDARVTLTILTHRHADHAESAPRWAELTGAPTRAAGPGHDDLADGAVLDVGGLSLRVVATPGHTSDSISLVIPADEALVTGDTILGHGTTVVAYPDGNLAAYLTSLEELARLGAAGEATRILPGHGPTLPDASAAIAGYLAHRRERLAQVEAALAEGAAAAPDRVEAVRERVYGDVPEALWPAARQSIRAQLAYLDGEGPN